MRLCAVAAVAVVVLTGCSGEGSSPAGPEAPEPTGTATLSYAPPLPGISAEAYQTRVDEAVGDRFQIALTNTSAVGFTVVGTGLDSAGFTRLPLSPRETTFGPGARIDLPTPYGSALCDAGTSAEPAYAVLDVVGADGVREQLRAPLPSVATVLTRIHERECAADALAAAVTVEFVDLVAVGAGAEQAGIGRLQVTRADASGSISVTGLRGSVLYKITPGTDFPVEIATGQALAGLPVTITPRTCEAHTIAETKQPFLFPLFISFDGAEAVYSEIPVPEAQRDLLFGVVEEVCGL